jgi:adenylate cyclase
VRNIQDVVADVREADRVSDRERLEQIGEELGAMGSKQADAVALLVAGLVAELRGQYAHAVEMLVRLRDRISAADDAWCEATYLTSFGIASMRTGNTTQARALLQEAVDRWRALSDDRGLASTHLGIGALHATQGEFAMALEQFDNALACFRAAGDLNGQARAYCNLGHIASQTSDMQRAVESYRRSLGFYEQADNLEGQADVIGSLGTVHYLAGYMEGALEYHHRALQLQETNGNDHGIATVCGNLGMVYAQCDEYASAMTHYARSLALYEAIGMLDGAASTYTNMGVVAGKQGDLESALSYHRQALRLREELGVSHRTALVYNNIASVLIGMRDYESAAELLDRLAQLPMSDARTRAYYHTNRGTWAREQGHAAQARTEYMHALSIATESGHTSIVAEAHAFLRDLARDTRDFDDFVDHSDAFATINADVQGRHVAEKMALIEAERRIAEELHERDKERAVLYSTLPRDVADRIVRGETISGDRFAHASILFTDVVGFTSRTAHMEPTEVVVLLAQIFTAFDEICSTHGVAKIKTIGDAYMCFKGDLSATENALAVAHTACSMCTTTVRWPDGSPVELRIGMHCGPVSAGVIGTQRLQYDIWGDTVNVASRMESSGAPGRMHVSAAFADALASCDDLPFMLVERGNVDVKGKGVMSTYWLEARQ